jgi:hypothetical protein
MKTWPLQDVQAQYAEFVDDDLSAAPKRMIERRLQSAGGGRGAPKTGTDEVPSDA